MRLLVGIEETLYNAAREGALRVDDLVRRLVGATRPPIEPDASEGFGTEAEMVGILGTFARVAWVERNPECTWAILEEQAVHSRIADLVLVRLDDEVLRARVEGGWLRPLRLTELRALRVLRSDRATTRSTVATRLRMTEDRAGQILRELANDGFVARSGPFAFRRLAPSRPIAQRVVTFEVKRSDAARALNQARAHRAWADETYVAFDQFYRSRFLALTEAYSSSGVGLIELSGEGARRHMPARPKRRSNRIEASLAGEQALARLLGHAALDRPERRLPHGGRLSDDSEPELAGPGSEWFWTLTARQG